MSRMCDQSQEGTGMVLGVRVLDRPTVYVRWVGSSHFHRASNASDSRSPKPTMRRIKVAT